MNNENGSKASDVIQQYFNKHNEVVKDLTEVINKHSLDTFTNSPDYILAEHLTLLIELQASMDMKTKEWNKTK